MQIDDNNLGQAVDLLVAGFPERSRAFWETGIDRLRALPAHAKHGIPIGHLLMSGTEAVGVGLSAANDTSRFLVAQQSVNAKEPALAVAGGGNRQSAVSRAKSSPPICYNLASWYVRPDHRWKLPILLRKLLADRDAVYTDLTPTIEVQQILAPLGFEPINNGVKIVNTAARAVQAAGAAVVQEWDGVSQLGGPNDSLGDIETVFGDHLGYRCLALEIADDTSSCRLLLKPRTIRYTPTVQVIFCDDTDALERGLAALCRWLIARRYLALIMDVPVGASERTTVSQIVMPERRRRFVRNGWLNGQTDYTYSELVLFDL